MERRDQWSGEEGEEGAGEQKAGKSSNKSPWLLSEEAACVTLWCAASRWKAQVELETESGCETSTNRGFDTCRTKRGRREGAALNGFLSPITFSSRFPFFDTGPCLSCEGWWGSLSQVIQAQKLFSWIIIFCLKPVSSKRRRLQGGEQFDASFLQRLVNCELR